MIDTKSVKRFFGVNTVRAVPYIGGTIMTINFIICWAIPIFFMGSVWKYGLKYPLKPVYEWFEKNESIRSFAHYYVYKDKRHADYFLTSILLIISSSIALGTVFYYQLTLGYLPYWLIIAYYFSWVGVGGRIMGAAYALGHKEGHNQNMYRDWIKNSVGNFFENWLGCFFGNVPYNFSTSHVFIHHALDGGTGDTFYEWDIDRTNIGDFMLYVYRIFLHMIGYSSLKYFSSHNDLSRRDKLTKGVRIYIAVGLAVLLATKGSLSFVFWIYLQPLMCMTYFLAFLNIGFHGFIEFDSNGKSIEEVNSTTIIEGEDDYFGEDDHMAHHYHGTVFYQDLKDHQAKQLERFKEVKASVFRGLSIVELSIFILLGLWDKLAEHYVDYSGKLTTEEIKKMLKTRAKTTEISYEEYEEYLSNPTREARKNITAMKKRE